MKDIHLFIWLTQLGFSIVFPLAGFILLALWLRDSCGWGDWVVAVGIVLGVANAISGFRGALQAMHRTPGSHKDEKKEPPIAFNDHD